VATHLATSLVLLGFFWNDWQKIVKGVFQSLKKRKVDYTNTYERLGWLIVVATIPAGILGLLFQESFQKLFASPKIASIFLILNGLMLCGAEIFIKRYASIRKSGGDETIAKLSWTQTVKIGLAQSLALIPGLSRTGSALAGGLFVGLDHKDSARFAFLLATPIIFAASVLKIPELFNSTYSIIPMLSGFFMSGVTAYFSIKFLTKYFKTKTLNPFGLYCMTFGLLSLFVLMSR
jgi:undecaprenyl-diphosphatase